MSTDTAIQLTYVVGGLAAGLTLLWVFTRRQPSEAERVVAARARVGLPTVDSYQGPDSLRLMQDLDTHLDGYAAAIAGLYEQPHVAPDPVLAAGRERLWDAVRDTNNDHLGD